MQSFTLQSFRAALAATSLLTAAGLPGTGSFSLTRPAVAAGANGPEGCPGDNGGLTLAPGFCATVFADNIGHARHLVVARNGVVYVNTWSGRYYRNEPPPPGGFLVALQDTKGDGRADMVVRFGETPETGGAGGTGIGIYNGGLFAEINDRIVRYALPATGIAPSGKPEIIVSDLPLSGDHPMHPFIISEKGDLLVDLGSATNACQIANRMTHSPGHMPCTELETRGGIWRYDANKTGQHFSPKERFATGLRNGEGFAYDFSGRLFATQHGRDQLSENWPELYQPEQGANEPAEELVALERGSDYGWPECYFDYTQQKLVLAPEYRGDGGKIIGICAQKQAPVASFPAHWAPNDLLIYKGEQFPVAYRGSAFIAFHGSWNRAPFPQEGYDVVVQPLADGHPSGPFVPFADGFSGPDKTPGGAMYRPTGLAAGPDGALYIADDVRGRIWRVVFQGDATAKIEAAPAAPSGSKPAASSELPPEGIHPEAGAQEVAALPTPAGATPQEVALGAHIFRGEVAGGTCAGCHGTNGEGSPLGPSLRSAKWLWGDGSLASITQIIDTGVSNPKQYRGVMPPKGGAELSQSDVKAVAAYVWAISHPASH
ncbi:MAG TPA: c-type cytochrome [Methylocella sp.]|nr:c-type cytochrome [Methylocella sp.]